MSKVHRRRGRGPISVYGRRESVLLTEAAVYKGDPEQPPIVLDPETIFIHISLDIPLDHEESR